MYASFAVVFPGQLSRNRDILTVCDSYVDNSVVDAKRQDGMVNEKFSLGIQPIAGHFTGWL